MKAFSGGSRPDGRAPRSPSTFQSYFPSATIKCSGLPFYRSQAARDYACLLDVDSAVSVWEPSDIVFSNGLDEVVVDFDVSSAASGFLVKVREGELFVPDWLVPVAQKAGHDCRVVSPYGPETGWRLKNARDLLRYGHFDVALGDRIRLLAALAEMGSLTMAECLSVVRERNAVATIAAMILHGYLEVDLDEGPLGPETVVRRIER